MVRRDGVWNLGGGSGCAFIKRDPSAKPSSHSLSPAFPVEQCRAVRQRNGEVNPPQSECNARNDDDDVM